MKYLNGLVGLIAIVCFSCGDAQVGPPYAGLEDENFILPFALKKPDKELELGKELYEISGLTWGGDNTVYAVDDEDAILHRISLEDGAIIEGIDFGKDDDYEGVARFDSIVLIAESNGNIKKVDLLLKDKVGEFETFLSKRNDVEGLCFTKGGTHLLMACKEETESDDSDDERAVYRLDLAAEKLDEEPFILLNLQEKAKDLNKKFVGNNPVINLSLRKRLASFGPSAIDYDPKTGLIYILSSRGGLLVVTEASGTVKGIYVLSKRDFGQPEGLCFDPEGNLYISNEARATRANIKVFKRVEKHEIDLNPFNNPGKKRSQGERSVSGQSR